MRRLAYATLFLIVVLLLAGTLFWGSRSSSPDPVGASDSRRASVLGTPAQGGLGQGTAQPGTSFDTATRQVMPAGEPQFYGATLDPPRAAPDFTLTDQHGDAFRLSDHLGDVVVLFFGYTTCPDVCPGTLAQYRYVKRALGDKAEGIRFVFVTVDPERDSQERLHEYINLFDPEFRALRGSLDELQAVWRAYGVYVERVDAPAGSAAGYLVNHTSVSYVIDPAGMLRLIHFYGMPDDQVIRDLERILEEGQA